MLFVNKKQSSKRKIPCNFRTDIKKENFQLLRVDTVCIFEVICGIASKAKFDIFNE